MKSFQISQPLIQKYTKSNDKSTNKNANINSLFVCLVLLYFKIARLQGQSFDYFLRPMHAFEPDSSLRNGRHGGVQHVQQKKSEYEIFMKREKIYLPFPFKG